MIHVKERMPGNLIITIDGPSGAGKSTVARMLARSLHYRYIDTGAMYRGVALAYMKRGETRRTDDGVHGREDRVQEADRERVTQPGEALNGVVPENEMVLFLKGLDARLRFEFGEETRVFLDGHDVSGDIRAPNISLLASELSQDSRVRRHLYEMQRLIGEKGGVVLEGRDTGSVVFPDAHIKFYLDADPGVRAGRRHLELLEKGAGPDLATVEEEMVKRDRDDSERSIAPLLVPEGALRIDTTGLNLDGVLDVLLTYIARQGTIWKS